MIVLIQLSHLCLLVLRPFFVFPEFYVYPYLAAHGLVPYNQIIDQHAPSLLLTPINIYSAGFTDSTSIKILFILIILIQSCCVAIIARKLWPKKVFSLLSTLLFAIIQPITSSGLWYDTLTPLATLPAAIFLIGNYFFVAGIFLGLGLVLKQTLIVLNIALICFVYLKFGFKKAIAFITGIIVIPLLLLLYLNRINALYAFLNWTVTFNLTTYPHLASLFPGKDVLFIAMIFVCTAIIFWKKIAKTIPLQILVLIGIGASVGGLTRLNMYHLHGSIPFICIMLAALALRRQTYALLVALFIIYLGIQDTYRVPVNYDNQTTQKIANQIRQYVLPKSHIFLLGAQPHLYALSQTLPAGDLFFFHLPWYLTLLQDRQLAAFTIDPPRLIVLDESSRVDNIPIQDSAPKLLDYVHMYYLPTQKIDSYTFYVPK